MCSPAAARWWQPRGPRGAGRWQQDGLVHHDAGQDRVSLGAPGPDLHLDRVPGALWAGAAGKNRLNLFLLLLPLDRRVRRVRRVR